MADFTKDTAADIAADHPGINAGTTGSMHEIDWDTEDAYWQSAYPARPYARADRSFAFYRPAYRYGAAAAVHYRDREWSEVEEQLQRDWENYPDSSQSPWEEAKAAIRDAWDHVRGRSKDDRTHIR